MFAKLKKKIQEEGGGSDGEKSGALSPGPGLASPVSKTTPVGSLFSPLRRDSKLGSTDSVNNVSLDEGTKESTKEEVLGLLIKRTEQVKKLEAKISDLVANVKDKVKSIEKLENTLEKQQDNAAKRLQDLTTEHKADIDKLNEEHQTALQKKEEEKAKLSDKLKEADEFRDKYYKQEEANEEFQGLTTQEMAKIKHLADSLSEQLLNTQEELSQSKKALDEKTAALDKSEKNEKELQNIIKAFTDQLDELTETNGDLKKEKSRLENSVQDLISSKEELEKLNTSLKEELSEKSTALSAEKRSHTQLIGDHQTLQRNSDLHRSKTATMIEEKDETISHLQERVQTLEKRVQDSNLDGDERVTALEAERTLLEKKVTEGRQHLMEVKSTWSDKISHLERQISHLNTKIAEDSEEHSMSRKSTEEATNKFKQQIEELKSKLKEEENRITELQEVIKSKERLLEEQKENSQAELLRCRNGSEEKLQSLQVIITTLQEDLKSQKHAWDQDKVKAKQTILEFENSQKDFLDREIEKGKQVKKLEDDLQSSKKEYDHNMTEISDLKNKIIGHLQNIEQLTSKISSLEGELSEQKSQAESSQKTSKSYQLDLQLCTKEKDILMLRNAELSQQYETLRRTANQEKGEADAELREKTDKLSTITKLLDERDREVASLKQEFEEFKKHHEAKISALESAEITRLKEVTGQLEDQLAEKTKTVKMQQQRLTDLKKTLQRELKVQTLPNDEIANGSDSEIATQSKATTSSHQSQTSGNHSNLSQTDGFDAAFITHKSTHSPMPVRKNMQPVPGENSGVNIVYLKHVVLKFILSREAEAMHLVKAISVLLNFTKDEQKMIKETLEWKMSWFSRPRPQVGKGQTSKIIPPLYPS